MRWLYLLSLTLALVACGGGDPIAPAPTESAPPTQPQNPPPPTQEAPPPTQPQEPAPPTQPQEPPPQADACSLPAQQNVVRNYMTAHYFWYADMAVPDATAPDIGRYFSSLLYRPTDRYSYSEATETYNQRTNLGVRVGYGYSLVWDDTALNLLRVRNVEPKSPAALAGLQRGQVVVSIDGFTPQQVAAGQLPGVGVAGVPRRFVVRDANGTQRTIDMVSAEFPLTVVPAATTFSVTRGDGSAARVGYLAYQSFATYGDAELGAAMKSFAAAGVDELVLDLRYNGGGSVNVSRDLASMIGGTLTMDRLYAYLRFNAKQPQDNRSILFLRGDAVSLPAPALEGLRRLVVITGPGTASASELVINGLKPFMPVVLVGDKTYGKPFGSVVQDYCGTTYSAIHFTTLNSLGQGDYAQGFTPDCSVGDDLDHALGDPAEARIAAALHVVKTGQCPVQPAQGRPKAGAVPPRVLGEFPPPVMTVD